MKLKCIPADFQVYELSELKPSGGSFALYLLRKEGLGTPEAVTAILQRWNLSRQKLHYGGLKDRHAVTEQFITIQKGPARNFKQDHLELIYLGQVNQPFKADHFRGNRFVITMRDLNLVEVDNINLQIHRVKQTGVPNYFDDQRFGSLGYSGEYIGGAWCLGKYERALFLALAEENEHDRSDEKKQKKLVRENWGQWLKCKEVLARSNRRSVMTYLCDHPENFKQAFALIRVDMRSLYLSAFQSHLWNKLLSEMIKETSGTESLEVTILGREQLNLPGSQIDEPAMLRLKELPLPSARLKFAPDDEVGKFYATKLEQWGWPLRELRVKYPRDSFFSRGNRAGVIIPAGLTYEFSPDELYPGKQKCQLNFELPRGAYATMVVKSLLRNINSDYDQETDEGHEELQLDG